MDIVEKRIRISGVDPLSLLGINDSNLQIISDRFDANIIVRGDNITIKGEEDETERVEKVFKELMYVLDKTGVLRPDDVVTVVELISGEGEKGGAGEVGEGVVAEMQGELHGVTSPPYQPRSRRIRAAVSRCRS